jgi:sRNA-binding carbon storage regulator CsrA
MGMLKLRRNLGEKVIIQSPLGKLEVLVESSTQRAVILGFDGPSDYTIHREESANKALQNEGAKIAYYSYKLLEGSYWGKEENCYDRTHSLLNKLEQEIGKSKVEFNKVATQPKNGDYLYRLIERELKDYRIVCGRQDLTLVSNISKISYFLDVSALTCYAQYHFINSIPVNLRVDQINSFGFRYYNSSSPNYFSPRRIDFHA